MKYFMELMYDGTGYAGWQRQPNAVTVQEVLEDRLSKILGKETSVLGCGRTDKGVHARQYFLHLDLEEALDPSFLFHLNNFLPRDIAVLGILPVPEEAHARFDAVSRSYGYYIHYVKNPFRDRQSFYYQRAAEYSPDTLNAFVRPLLGNRDFRSFAKFHSDVYHFRVDLQRCEWRAEPQGLKLEITADRFLRGMVRLIAGACLRYAEGKLSLEDLHAAMSSGQQIRDSWSVPAHGLYLEEVVYPYFR